MEENGIIRKSRSPWASPLCLVLRKNGKIRPCVEYRKLNAVTNPDAFPLTRVQDCLDAVAGAKYFSTVDLTSGYHQVPMTFMCTRNIPKTDEIGTSGSSMENLPIYLDDVVVFGSSVEEHMERVSQVFECIRQAKLKLKPEKCQLLQKEVTFLVM